MLLLYFPLYLIFIEEFQGICFNIMRRISKKQKHVGTYYTTCNNVRNNTYVKVDLLWWSLARSLSLLYYKVIYILIGKLETSKTSSYKTNCFCMMTNFCQFVVCVVNGHTNTMFVRNYYIVCPTFITDYTLSTFMKEVIDIMRQ